LHLAAEKKPDHLVEGEAEVEVKPAEGGSPHVSIKAFEELNISPDLLKGVYAKKFTKPSKIQANALPIIVRFDISEIWHLTCSRARTVAPI